MNYFLINVSVKNRCLLLTLFYPSLSLYAQIICRIVARKFIKHRNIQDLFENIVYARVPVVEQAKLRPGLGRYLRLNNDIFSALPRS